MHPSESQLSASRFRAALLCALCSLEVKTEDLARKFRSCMGTPDERLKAGPRISKAGRRTPKASPKPISKPADHRQALEQQLSRLDDLPAGSSYARHRRAVLHKALELLAQARWVSHLSRHVHSRAVLELHRSARRSEEPGEELAGLLAELGLK